MPSWAISEAPTAMPTAARASGQAQPQPRQSKAKARANVDGQRVMEFSDFNNRAMGDLTRKALPRQRGA